MSLEIFRAKFEFIVWSLVDYRTARTKPEIALAEIDRAIAAGVRFGCVLADAGYGLSAPFRQGLTARKLAWAVGIPRHLKVYPADVQMIWPIAGPRPSPSAAHPRHSIDTG
jgi:SRSO17 transposase